MITTLADDDATIYLMLLVDGDEPSVEKELARQEFSQFAFSSIERSADDPVRP